jgi:hypothetical protein
VAITRRTGYRVLEADALAAVELSDGGVEAAKARAGFTGEGEGESRDSLGDAALTISSDRKSAHLEGTTDRASDAPGTTITVSVTC